MTKRRPLNRTETILVLQRQTAAPILCGCGCGKPLDPVTERVVDEHVIPRELSEVGRQGERDDLANRRFYRWPCALEKTRTDLAKIAKAKAQGGETGQFARRQKRGHGSIQSRGFDKTRTKRFDGSVVSRLQSEAQDHG
ncbi:hypothetical protein ACLBV5_13225 [Brevundimonas sp. M1A4_2e]